MAESGDVFCGLQNILHKTIYTANNACQQNYVSYVYWITTTHNAQIMGEPGDKA